MKFTKYIATFLLLLLPFINQAQQVDMADNFRKEGKIYVVVTIVATILIGIFVYLFLLDRKIDKIDKQLKK